MAYIAPLKLCWEYFPNRKGTITGIINSGFSSGGIVYSFLSNYLINPTNSGPNKIVMVNEVTQTMYGVGTDVVSNFPIAMQQIGWIILVCMVVANMIIYQKADENIS